MIEFEEPREIPASHLVRARCCGCGAEALCVPERARTAQCGGCLLAAVGGSGAMVRLGAYTPVVGYPMGKAPKPAVERPESFPEPLVSSRQRAEGVARPGAVRGILAGAVAAGWQTRVQYAYGHGQHARTGRPLNLQHSIGLRFAHAESRLGACAVYVQKATWEWQSMFGWGADFPIRKFSFTAFKKWLLSTGSS